jgi:tRNA pseudouridine55 synthase
VLIVGVGKATRLIEYVQRMPKQYRATFLLGRRSATEDVEGEVVELSDPPIPTAAEVAAAAARLTGWIEQRPPSFSALKVGGRRAYDLARKGQPVELAPRKVRVERLEVESYDYPALRLWVECGSGTYVRSLGRDLARGLGTAAVMSQLVRTAIGRFRIEEAADPDRLDPANWQQHLLTPLCAVQDLPQVRISLEEVARIRRGQCISAAAVPAGAQEVAALDPSGRLAAILIRAGPGELRPHRNLLENA